jgi:3-hydroxyacyl-CoA dehydrogenase
MAPLTQVDLIGLEVLLFILAALPRHLGKGNHWPVSILWLMVEGGRQGRESGYGFFDFRG